MSIRVAFVVGLLFGLLLMLTTGSVLAFDPKGGQASAKVDKDSKIEQRQAQREQFKGEESALRARFEAEKMALHKRFEEERRALQERFKTEKERLHSRFEQERRALHARVK